jgi:nucleotide sugar dehydrogenase
VGKDGVEVKKMKIAVIGTGYVGTVTGACLAKLGHEVVCVDSREAVVKMTAEGKPHISEPGLAEVLMAAVKSDKLTATTDLKAACEPADAVLVCVGTPSRQDGSIDLSQIEAVSGQIGAAIAKTTGYKLVIIRSTVLPGTTRKLVLPAIEKASGKKAGKDFGLCMTPEFLREGNAVEDFANADRVVIGELDAKSGKTAEEIYAPLKAPMLHYGLETAELIKYAANSLFATLISYSNEIARVAEKHPGVDAIEVLKSVEFDRRITSDGKPTLGWTSYLRTGAGFGGSCFPKDVAALAAYAKEAGFGAPLLEAVLEENARARKAAVALAQKACGGSLAGKKVAVLGLAFKPFTDDVRESASLYIIPMLLAKEATVVAADPQAQANGARELGAQTNLSFAATPQAALTGADVAMILTAWPEFKLPQDEFIKLMKTPVIVDCRRLLDGADYSKAQVFPIGRG